ncbi:MAG: hypothetical protein K8R90_03165 [Candidatus Cloacimonetes bacterium]|nr:hypothetical protein [Candidatus Cloacimonadota bacterium]
MNLNIFELNKRVRRLTIIDLALLQVGTFCLAMMLARAVPALRNVGYGRWLKALPVLARPLMVLCKR